MISARSAGVRPGWLARVLRASLAALCLLAATQSHALNWREVVDIAQGKGTARANVSDAEAQPKPPPIDGPGNMGTNSSRRLGFTCPKAGAKVLTAGISNAFEELEFSGGCTCKVLCPPPLGPLPTGGVVMKFWQGSQFLEVVRHRGCSPVAGTKIALLDRMGNMSSGGNKGFYHVHAWPNPLLAGVAAAMGSACHVSDPVPLLYFSEIDPTWNPAHDAANLASPLSWPDLLANDKEHIVKKALWQTQQAKLATAQVGESLACVAECLAIAAGANSPLFSRLPFSNCSGCNGQVAPYNGHVAGTGGRRGAELLAHRFTNLMMNRGFLKSTSGSEGYCSQGVQRGSPRFPKTEFRLQSLYPSDEDQMRKLGAPFVTIADEAGKQGEFDKQDYVFILWQRRECCASVKYCPAIPG